MAMNGHLNRTYYYSTDNEPSVGPPSRGPTLGLIVLEHGLKGLRPFRPCRSSGLWPLDLTNARITKKTTELAEGQLSPCQTNGRSPLD